MIRGAQGALPVSSPKSRGRLVLGGSSALPPNSLTSQQLRCTKARRRPPASAGRLPPWPSATQEPDLPPYPCLSPCSRNPKTVAQQLLPGETSGETEGP